MMKRMISMLLVLVMVFTAIPWTAMAEEDSATHQQTGSDAPVLTAESGDFSYSVSGTNCTILGYTGSDVDVVIPETLDGYTVTAIGAEAFYKKSAVETVTMSEGITSIGYYAFYGCSAVTSIHLADSVSSIAYGAFQNCTSLEEINYPLNWEVSASKGASNNYGYIFSGCSKLTYLEIPEGVTAIPSRAFQSCPNFVEIKLPSTLQSIGYTAFSGCSALSKINFPDNLTSIGNSAFVDCDSLTEVILPDSLTTLGDTAFSSCDNLSKIAVPGSVATVGAGAFSSCKSLECVSIGEGTQSIGQGAFSGCSALWELNLPSALTTVGASAFFGCTSLVSVQLPDSITSIAYGAFQNCTSLEEINYPLNWEVSASKGASNNYGYIFSGCSKLTYLEIPEGVTAIPSRAFQSCPNFVEIKLPSTLQSIGYTAFSGCSALSKINFPDNLTSIGNSAFVDCDSLTEVILPDSLTTLGDTAFSSCDNLSKIAVPGSVATVGAGAFSSCKSLECVSIGEGTQSIGQGAFSGCSALWELNLPSTLTTISYTAFSGCTSLVSVRLPDSISSIAYGAFQNCSALEEINYPLNWEVAPPKNLNYGSIFAGCTKLTHLDIPEGVTTIPFKAFVNCSNFIEITFPSTLKTIESYAFSDCSGLTVLNLPEGLSNIGNGVFQNCDGLTEITIPGSLESISGQAFVSCKNLRSVTVEEGCTEIDSGVFSGCIALEEVNLPSTLTTIGDTAFSGCTSLVSVQLPDSITSIGYGAFKNCSALTDINFPLNWTETTQYNDGNYGRIFQGCTSLTRMVVPEGVKTIPYYAFSFADGLKEVVLPSTLETIGEVSFYQCTALETVNIPESVATIGRSALSYCGSLKTVSLPAGVKLGNEVFLGCTSLTEITIPATVSMGTAVFAHCTALRTATLEEGITQIPQSTFYNCTALYHVDLPNSLTSIGSSAFGCCTSLTGSILPDALTTISGNAFNGCTNLTTLFIPDAVTSIGSGAFTGCSNLTLYCGKQSYGASYAIAQGIPLEFYDTEWVPVGLDRNDSWFRINLDSVSVAGYLSVVTGYAFLEETSPKNMELYFYIPKEAQLIESTLTLDGATCTNYSISGTTLTIPVTEKTGTVRFSLKPSGYARVTTYAGIKYSLDGTKYNEVIDTIYVEMPILSISAVGETASEQVAVSGVTRPGSVVSISVEGEEQTTVTANKAGDYSATVTLKNLSNGKRYDIIASTSAEDGTLLSSRTVVTYREDSPTVTLFNISHNGLHATLEEASTSRPVLVFNPSQNFRFEVDFNVTTAISKVFIVSTRNNISKFMVAEWNQETGTYIAEGYFDEDNHGYVPGAISIQYILTNGEMSIEKGYDFTSEEAINALPDSWQDATVEVLEDTADTASIVVKAEDGSSIRMTTIQQSIPEGVTRENAEALGYQRTVDSEGNELYIKRYAKPDAYEYDIISFSGEYAVKQILDECFQLGTPVRIYDFATSLSDGVSNDATYQQMSRDILKSDLSYENKIAALEELEAARDCGTMITIMRVAGVIAAPAVAALTGALVGPAALFVGSVILAGELCALDAMLEYANDLTLWRMSNMMYQLEEFGYSFIPRYVIDPSGYVYDAETQERIAGATVTAYWIPYDETDEAFWDNVPAEDNYGQLWDASEYSQRNPMNTDLDGRYAWDVPEGWWRVKCEADCYETAWSQWLPVPPPQMDVNIAMTPGNHTWDEGSVTKEPTEEEAGEKRFTCIRCGETKTESIPPAEHVHSYHSEVTAPTCTEQGYTTYLCACGHSYVEDYIEPLGHTYENGKCTVCGEADPDFVAPVEPALSGVIRIAGADRIDTSLGIADQLKRTLDVDQFSTVIVASALNFPDALTGSYLAAVKSAPILLTYHAANEKIAAYIGNNLAPGGTVYILGGSTAVSDDFEEMVSSLNRYTVKRLAGSDRFGTNLAILEEAGVSHDQEILICTATGFADSLSASAAGLPILLAHGTLREDQKRFLEGTSGNFVIIGGTSAVSSSLEAELDAIGDVERVAGENRYQTSVKVAKEFVSDPDAVVLAYARNFPDGLCGGPLAIALNAPLVLTDIYDPSEADTYVSGIRSGVVVGDSPLISDAAVRAIFDMPSDAQIIDQ